MTQEEKQLLFRDLCERLPYGVKVCVGGCICTLLDINTELGDKLNGETFHTAGFNKSNGDYDFCAISEVKPYLRQISSMTEEEKEEYCDLQDKFLYSSQYPVTDAYELFDWLNEHHFDFRGLIEKGLALEAKEGMYKIK